MSQPQVKNNPFHMRRSELDGKKNGKSWDNGFYTQGCLSNQSIEFLIDSGSMGETAPMVNLFMQNMESPQGFL